MTSIFAPLALALALAQHTPEPAAHAPEAAEHGAVASPEHGAHAGEHGAAAGEHGAAGGHEGGHSLPEVMMHHVANGEVLELPGFCDGFRWNCEVNLRELTGGGWVLHLGGLTLDMTPSKHVVMLWVAALVLLAIFGTAGRQRALVPRGFYNLLEMLVLFVRDEIAIKNIGKEEGPRYVPYLLLGLLLHPLHEPAGPGALDGDRHRQPRRHAAASRSAPSSSPSRRASARAGLGGYLAHLTGGVPRGVAVAHHDPGGGPGPVHQALRPHHPSLRQHAGGPHRHLLPARAHLHPRPPPVALVAVPFAIGIYLLELFVAFVQAYVFTMLSALFIGMGVAMGHHEHGDGHEEHGHGAAHGHGAPRAPRALTRTRERSRRPMRTRRSRGRRRSPTRDRNDPPTSGSLRTRKKHAS